jgi:uncharacterized membrane protein
MKEVKTMVDSDSKLFALLGILLTIVGFIIAMLVKKDNKYVMFYAKQGLVLFITGVILGVGSWILNIIPFIGQIISGILGLLLFLLWILGIIYSLSGEEKNLPVLGEFAKKINV